MSLMKISLGLLEYFGLTTFIYYLLHFMMIYELEKKYFKNILLMIFIRY